MQDGPTLFLNHTHTYRSNDFTADIKNTEGIDHHTDYLAITEQLPEDIDVIYNRTEHFKTGEQLYEDIRDELDNLDEPYEQHDTHLWFEREGTEAAIINSVEATLEQDNWHVLITGLPIQEETYYNLSEDELLDAAADAAWFAPAHPFINNFRIPDSRLESMFEKAQERDDTTAALCYSTGYTPQVNRLAQGRETRLTRLLETVSSGSTRQEERDVFDYAEEYELDLVPELDLHAILPEGLEGAGVIDEPVMDQLHDGELPGDAFLDTDVLSYSGPGTEGLSWRQFITTFPGTVPLNRYLERFLPSTAEDFQAAMEQSIAELEFDSTDIEQHTYNPGQWHEPSS
ncbi:MAG: hypothetical protein SVU32_01055 [Candidatus Nanohaloarchaea archaeon]|nr:hypothetical protein [Candidatus Nanohaloarchaea archaeon]